MVTYDYKCPKCGCRTDILRYITADDEDVFCKECGAKMSRVITGGHGFCMERVGGVTRYRKEGTERAGARADYVKKNPYSEVPDSLK